jgi:hypothetical protein
MRHNYSAIKQFIFFKKEKVTKLVLELRKQSSTHVQTHPNHKRQKTTTSFLQKLGENVIKSSIL